MYDNACCSICDIDNNFWENNILRNDERIVEESKLELCLGMKKTDEGKKGLDLVIEYLNWSQSIRLQRAKLVRNFKSTEQLQNFLKFTIRVGVLAR